MEYRALGRTGLQVSALSLGASGMGGVFGPRDEEESLRTVHAALDAGINYIDTSPYYGLTRSEQVVGKALEGHRHRVILSTKTGRFGEREFDFSADRIRREVEASLRRLRTETVDILFAHDIEFGDPGQVLGEGIPTLFRLKEEGKTRFVGVSGLPLDVLDRAAREFPLDVILSYCHYCLNDTSLEPYARRWREQGIGVINASPHAMGLLRRGEPPAWHPAPPELRAAARRAAELCASRGADLARLALQFAYRAECVDTTLSGMSRRETLRRNLDALAAPVDEALLREVLRIFEPVHNLTWPSGNEEAWRADPAGPHRGER
ncbi:MAG: oxidoreductase [Candidatus Poribacteria bacterium]|nr:MAG: oxidoreductase [Candidatus Poribacteria bacterium]